MDRETWIHEGIEPGAIYVMDRETWIHEGIEPGAV